MKRWFWLVLLCLGGLFVDCQCQHLLVLGDPCRFDRDCPKGQQCVQRRCVASEKGQWVDAHVSIPEEQLTPREVVLPPPESYPGEPPGAGCPEIRTQDTPQKCFCRLSFLRPYSHAPGGLSTVFARQNGQLASFDTHGWLYLWNTQYQSITRYAKMAYTSNIRLQPALAIHPSGLWIATAATGKQAELWQVDYKSKQLKKVLTLPEATSDIQQLYFDPTGQILVAATKGKMLYLWKLQLSSSGASHGKSVIISAHKDTIVKVDFHPKDKDVMAVISDDQRLRFWKLQYGSSQPLKVQAIAGFSIKGKMYDIAFTPDGSHLALNGINGFSLYKYPMKPGDISIGYSSLFAEKIHFSSDGKLVALSAEKTIYIASIQLDAQGLKLKRLSTIQSLYQLETVQFHPKKPQLWVSNKGGMLYYWEQRGDKSFVRTPFSTPGSDYAVHPQLGWLAIGRQQHGFLEWYSIRENKRLSLLKVHDSTYFTGLAFHPSGKYLLVGDVKNVRVLSLTAVQGKPATARLTSVLPGVYPRFPFSHMRFSDDGKYLALVDNSERIQLWSFQSSPKQSARLLRLLPRNEERVLSMAFAADGSWLASATDNKVLRFWKLRKDTRGQLHIESVQVQRFQEQITALAVSPDNRYLMASYTDRSIRLWKAEKAQQGTWRLKLESTFQSPTKFPVLQLSFHKNRPIFASVTRTLSKLTSRIHLWGQQSGRIEQTLEGGFTSINHLRFSKQNQLYYFSPAEIRQWTCP